MDDPLIRPASTSTGRPNTFNFKRRSDAIAYGTPYQKAAALVDLAEDGIGLPVEVLEGSRFEKAAKFYFIFMRFNLLWSLNLVALLLLNFLEEPLWCANTTPSPCNDRQSYFLGELPYLTLNQALVYEGVTLLILILHTLFPVLYEGWDCYWKKSLNVIKVVFLLLLMGDLFVDALYVTPGPITSLPLRFAPYIRVIFVILNIRELRVCMLTLAGMAQVYFDALAMGFLFMLFSSWLAYVIFEDTIQGSMVFKSYGATLYQMFVLFTTSNNPDVWIPGYKSSRWYCLFFVLYVLLGVYFVTNLILAVVYDSFKEQLAKQVVEMDTLRKNILTVAFNILDEHKQGFLNKEQCIYLFEELNNYRSLPRILRDDFECIFYELDDSGDFKINCDEFADLCNAISLRFQKEATGLLMDSITKSRCLERPLTIDRRTRSHLRTHISIDDLVVYSHRLLWVSFRSPHLNSRLVIKLLTAFFKNKSYNGLRNPLIKGSYLFKEGCSSTRIGTSSSQIQVVPDQQNFSPWMSRLRTASQLTPMVQYSGHPISESLSIQLYSPIKVMEGVLIGF
ncbi:hypothetical protein AMTR_s00068p00187210 [Amborella trichopoda]|uniref:Ion transport domain-containing protein n=1 Tax=Amborella trichopoda TaxID=13333 RepID=U5DE89_AMBTC|nr:hypothetical protein AMTR_s00068p00187210 [Amborella trichopoda]